MAIVSLTVAVLFAASAVAAPVRAQTDRVAVWSEFLDYAYVEKYIPELKAHNASLYLAVDQEALDSDKFYHCWAAVADAGIEIRPWILLRHDQGYWANKWNEPLIEKLVWDFVNSLEAHGLSTGWITLDLEPPAEFYDQLTAKFKKFDLVGVWKLLAANSRNGSITKAMGDYAALVRRLHEHGIKVHAVTSPLTLHDFKNRKFKVQSALGVPFQDIPWDEASFLTYRTEFAKLIPNAGPDVVYEYGKKAHQYFGARAALDLGEAGDVDFPAPTTGFHDVLELWRDEGAAEAAGVDKLHVYSLDGLAKMYRPATGGIEPWLAVPPAMRPPRDSNVHFYMWLIDVFASLLPKGK